MKKFLFATTALAGLIAGSAFAEGPTVSVGGTADFQAGFTDQDAAYEVGANSRKAKFANDTRVAVKVNGKADNGLAYGAVIELQADVSDANDNSGINADRTYLFVESGFGRFEMGSNYGVAKTLKVDASTFARATGGIDGDWYYYANTVAPAAFILSPDLPLDKGFTQRGESEDATKLTYYSPRYAGLQFGASYTPDSGNRGTAAAFTSKSDFNQYENVFDLGVNYTNQYDQVGFAAAVTGQIGDAEASNQEDLRAYAVGASVNYAGFTIGGSYGDLTDSGQLKTANAGDADYWTVGAGYVQGPFGASLTYIDSDNDRNKFSNLSFGADYQLAPGFVPYAEISFFEIEPADRNVTKNDGTVFIVGTQLNF